MDEYRKVCRYLAAHPEAAEAILRGTIMSFLEFSSVLMAYDEDEAMEAAIAEMMDGIRAAEPA